MPVWYFRPFKVIRYSLAAWIIVAIGLVGIVGVSVWLVHRPLRLQSNEIYVELLPGTSLTQFAHQLKVARVFTKLDKRVFITLGQLSGNAQRLQAGEYALKATTTVWQLLQMLVQGNVVLHKVTFPEGITFAEVRRIMQTNPHVTVELSKLPEAQIRAYLGMSVKSLEGMFYPDTYLFPKGTSDKVILHQAFQRMWTILQAEWQQRHPSQPYQTAYDALIGASLIEKETANADERFLIAAVIANRLRLNQALQIDATVIYALQDTYPGVLTRTHLKYASPYNTYLHRGLPPSPIALVSRQSLYAALHPVKTENLYYVARGDGSGTHMFADHLSQHLVNVQTVKQQWRIMDEVNP